MNEPPSKSGELTGEMRSAAAALACGKPCARHSLLL